MNAAIHSPSPLAGEGGTRSVTDEGAGSASLASGNSRTDKAPSSAPLGHLLPQGEKGRKAQHTLPQQGEKEGKAQFTAPLQGKKYISNELVRKLRRNMTDVEVKLWNALRGRRFENYKFRRQVPVGKYVADFMCYEHRLIVELDGSQHQGLPTDVIRDTWLKSQNFRVLRFWNVDINQALDGSLLAILEALK